MSGAKCFGDKHLKDQDLYCSQCCVRVCSKCFKDHTDHADKIVDIEQVLDKTINSLDDIKVFITENDEKRKIVEEEFKTVVEEEYNTEVGSITEYFKKLHDALYFKEVELKRELKSNFEENSEIFTQKSSLMENNITQSQGILKLINESQDDKDMLLKKFNEFKLLAESQKKQFETLHFFSKKFKEFPFNSFEENLNKNCIKSPAHFELKNARYIYFYYDELQRFDMTTKKMEKIDTKPNDKRPESIWQSMCSTAKNLYIFCRTTYWIYNPSNQTWNHKPVPNETDLGGYQPVFYDGKKHIYLLGGYKDNTFLLDVTRFNIETEEFEFKFAKLNASHQNNPLIIDGDETQIYMVGGYHHKDTDTLDVLDVTTRSVKTVQTFRHLGFPNLTTGVYVPAQNAIFMITREYLFFKYDLTTKSCVQLANPTGNGYYNKLFFDGQNLMFLTSTKLKHFLEYNIESNSWTTLFDFAPTSGYGSCQANF